MGYELKFYKYKQSPDAVEKARAVAEVRDLIQKASLGTQQLVNRLLASMAVADNRGEEFGEDLSGHGSYSRFLKFMGIELEPYQEYTAKTEQAREYREAYNRAKADEDFTINTWVANAIHPIAFALEAGYEVEFVWN